MGVLERTRRRARDLGVADHVDFPGGVSKRDVPTWLQRGNIFLNTTDVDNTPTSVLEAMACGLCVVSTNVGGIPVSARTRDRTPFWWHRGIPMSWRSAVRTLLTDDDLAQTLSRNAIQKARNMDWSILLPKWESLLDSIVDVAAARSSRAERTVLEVARRTAIDRSELSRAPASIAPLWSRDRGSRSRCSRTRPLGRISVEAMAGGKDGSTTPSRGHERSVLPQPVGGASTSGRPGFRGATRELAGTGETGTAREPFSLPRGRVRHPRDVPGGDERNDRDPPSSVAATPDARGMVRALRGAHPSLEWRVPQ